MNPDLALYAFKNLLHRRMRSFLSLLSIFIGITAIFSLVSFGIGINNYVDELAQEQGTDKLMIMPKGSNNLPGLSNVVLDEDDVDFLSRINGIQEIVPAYAGSAKIDYDDYRPSYPYFIGFSTEQEKRDLALEVFTVELLDGRLLDDDAHKEVILGYSYTQPDTIFEEPVRLGDEILINDISFEVNGFFEEIGNPGDDANVYITNEAAEMYLDKDSYEYIIIQATPTTNVSSLSDKIERQFRKHRGLDEGNEDFTVQTFEEAIAVFTNIFDVVVAVVILIALISVVVAAVNITNTMYTAVLERTQEIGVLKSLGSTNSAIQSIFIIEAGLLGAIGGVFGILAGYGIAKAGELIARTQGISMLQPAFPLWLIAGCILFSLMVGIFSGYLPSKQAAELHPVDALRYE